METKERRRNQRTRQPAKPKEDRDVVYTQPKPFNRNRFLLRLATVAAVVAALFFGMSIFFKLDVNKVTVSGCVKYDEWVVREAAGLINGENLLALSKGRISSNILAKLPYVATVRVDKQLPDAVHIEITELEVVYAIADIQENWYLMNSQGRIVDSCPAAQAEDYTRVLGVQITEPSVGSEAVAFEPATQESQPQEESAPVTVYAREKLSLALEILTQAEKFGFIGTLSTVDVTKPGSLEVWYSTRFQMLLGDDTQLDRKMDALAQSVAKLDSYQTGILDASFTFWPDEVGYTQFSQSK